jgi:hypothetical protein
MPNATRPPMSPVKERIGNGPFAAVQADRVKAAAHQQKDGVAQAGAQPQHGRPAQAAQVHGVAGLRGQRKKINAQAVQLGAGFLLDHALGHQALQDAVGGRLRQARGLGDVRDAPALGLRGGQRPDDGKGALHAAGAIVIIFHGVSFGGISIDHKCI